MLNDSINLARNSFWAEDYKNAIKYFLKYLEQESEIPEIKLYDTYLYIIISKIKLKKEYEEYSNKISNYHKSYFEYRDILESKNKLYEEAVKKKGFTEVSYDEYYTKIDSFYKLISPYNTNKMIINIKHKIDKLTIPDIKEQGVIRYSIKENKLNNVIRGYVYTNYDLKENIDEYFIELKRVSDIIYLMDYSKKFIISLASGRVLVNPLTNYDEETIDLIIKQLNNIFITNLN